MSLLSWLGDHLAEYLQKPSGATPNPPTCSAQRLAAAIQVGDVLLVDGVSRVSTAIKYLTQSTWSHAAFCVEKNDKQVMLLEADVIEGVRKVPLSLYQMQHTRICRPQGLKNGDIQRAIDYATTQLGNQYDTRHIFDLARYLIQTPPVPVDWRRSMLSLGSGDPTKAICSSLIAQIFQSIQYPIIPAKQAAGLVKRHHSLYVPSDFDISPYFAIIKPSLLSSFDPYALSWIEHEEQF